MQMNICKRITLLALAVALFSMQVFAVADTDTQSNNEAGQSILSGLDLSNIQITIDGVPVEDVLGAATGMFADEVEEHVGEAVNEINGLFGELAAELNASFGEIEGMVESMIEEKWHLRIADLSIDANIRRSAYDNCLDLYKAQADGEAEKGAWIAMDTAEGCGNNIIYIYDEENIAEAVLAAVENGALEGAEVLFGYQNANCKYGMLAVTYLDPSDEPFAMCNMSDLRDIRMIETYLDYVRKHAVRNYDAVGYGGPYVTIIFCGENSDAGWLTIVAQEDPMLLE